MEQGARVASSQSPYGCTVHQTACKEGITKMDKIAQVAGIDVSKDKLDVHVLASNQDFAVGRDESGLGDLVRRLRQAGIDEVAVEASGGYEREVIEALEAASAHATQHAETQNPLSGWRALAEVLKERV